MGPRIQIECQDLNVMTDMRMADLGPESHDLVVGTQVGGDPQEGDLDSFT